jgi:hypothetical protein
MQYTRFIVGEDISGSKAATSVTAPYKSGVVAAVPNIFTDSIV